MALQIHVNTGSSSPIYQQIVEQVRLAVCIGQLHEGEALPSVRGLASELVVNPNTVAKAYAQLARDGLIESRAGRGVFVTKRREVLSLPERQLQLEQALDQLIERALFLGFDFKQLRSALEERLTTYSARMEKKR